MGAVGVGAALLAVVLVIVAAFVWQGASRSPLTDHAEYDVPEAAEFVFGRLSERAVGRLDISAVRLILEWNLEYALVVAPGQRRVVGSGDGLEFVLDRAAGVALALEPIDVAEVLTVESEYLVSIGAVGPPVNGEVVP